MTTKPDIDEATRTIQRELTLNLSYFWDSGSERHFDPISVAVGVATVLLGSFLNGVMEGLKKEAKSAGENFTGMLVRRLKMLFANERASEELKQETVADARMAVESSRDVGAERVLPAVDATEHQLVVFLIEQRGMPRRDAEGIAQVLRNEVLCQLEIERD